MKILFTFVLVTVSLISCNSNTTTNQQPFSILGKWEMVKRISLDESYPLTQIEAMECTGNIVSFYKDSIITPKDTCFYGESFYDHPNYKLETVNALQYFEGDTVYLKLAGITKDTIQVITTNTGPPFASISILDDNKIFCGWNGYGFYLRRLSRGY